MTIQKSTLLSSFRHLLFQLLVINLDTLQPSNSTQTSKEGNLKVHPACAAAFGALEMPLKSRSYNTTALLADTSVLRWDHPAALGGQKIAKRNLKPNQFAKIETDLQRNNGTGKYAGFKGEDRHLVAKEKYKDEMEQGTGLAGHNADRELKLMTCIPEMCCKFPGLCRILSNGDGFDILPLKDDFGATPSHVRDLLAKFCHLGDFRSFQKRLCDPTTALGGMQTLRILENGEIVQLRGRTPAAYANAGYRFLFNEGNKNRFDIS